MGCSYMKLKIVYSYDDLKWWSKVSSNPFFHFKCSSVVHYALKFVPTKTDLYGSI